MHHAPAAPTGSRRATRRRPLRRGESRDQAHSCRRRKRAHRHKSILSHQSSPSPRLVSATGFFLRLHKRRFVVAPLNKGCCRVAQLDCCDAASLSLFLALAFALQFGLSFSQQSRRLREEPFFGTTLSRERKVSSSADSLQRPRERKTRPNRMICRVIRTRPGEPANQADG